MSAKKQSTKKTATRKTPTQKLADPRPVAQAADVGHPPELPPEIVTYLSQSLASKRKSAKKASTVASVRQDLIDRNIRPTVSVEALTATLSRMDMNATTPISKMRNEKQASIRAMKPETRRFHGSRAPLTWFPIRWFASPCANKFGYMSSPATRNATKLPFNSATRQLLDDLGDLMGDAGRDPNSFPQDDPTDPNISTIPAGYTYFGQFVDHDITLDVSSTLDVLTDATTINNMRSPSLDLDSVYGRGPVLDQFLYVFPSSGPSTAIKFITGSNRPIGPGGPSSSNSRAGMLQQSNWDVPRIAGTNTAVIGDPRNDENLIVSQFHHAMLRFHNAVVDLLIAGAFAGDIFAEAKKIVTHHYQWTVVHDYLERVCGSAVVANALATVHAPIGSHFRMPVEFSVAAYRFGHSMIRDNYWVNFNFPNATLGQVFAFIRPPLLPVFSNWVVDFNAFFDTGLPVVPVHNKARRIDSFIAVGLESLPGFAGMMAVLARRNLARGLALQLPSGQGMAAQFGVTPLTIAQLQHGLPANEVTLLQQSGGLLLQKTPLWYYVLREAAVLGGGNQLGPVGARIVAHTFVRMLKRDVGSFLNQSGFVPFLPAAAAGKFTVADLVNFAGVTRP